MDTSTTNFSTYIIIAIIILVATFFIYSQYKKHIIRMDNQKSTEGFSSNIKLNTKLNTKQIEHFTSSNFNEHSLLFPTQQKPLSLKITEDKPTLLLGTASDGTYPPVFGLYLAKHIYPSLVYYSKGSLASILGLLTEQVDMALVDEDILISALEASDNNNKYILEGMNKLDLPVSLLDDIENKISYIAPLYYQSMLLITKEGTNISKMEHLRSSYDMKKSVKASIGTLGPNSNNYYHLRKLLTIASLSTQDDVVIKIYDTLEELTADLVNDKLDCIYMTTNQKNKSLLDLSNSIKLRFIEPFVSEHNFIETLDDTYRGEMPIITFSDKSIKKWKDLENTRIGLLSKDFKKFKKLLKGTNLVKYTFQTYKKIDELFNSLINGEVSSIYLPEKQDRRELLDGTTKLTRENLYYVSPTVSTNQLKDIYTNRDRNINVMKDLIKRNFPQSYPYTLDLNSFYQNINTYNFVNTRATRMVLVCRSNLDDNHIAYLTSNLVSELPNLQKDINKYLYNKNIDNVDDKAFNIKELASCPEEFKIHDGAKEVFQAMGLVKIVEADGCDF